MFDDWCWTDSVDLCFNLDCIVYFIIQQLRMGLFGESLHWHSLNGPQAMETDMWRLFLFVSNWYLLRSFFTYFKCSRIPIWRIWFVLFALRWNDREDPGLYDLKWMDEDLQSTPLSKPLVMFDLLEPLTSYFMLYNYIVYFTPFIGGRYCAHWDILIRCWFITLWLKFLILPPWCHLFSITSIFRCIQILIFKMSAILSVFK